MCRPTDRAARAPARVAPSRTLRFIDQEPAPVAAEVRRRVIGVGAPPVRCFESHLARVAIEDVDVGERVGVGGRQAGARCKRDVIALVRAERHGGGLGRRPRWTSPAARSGTPSSRRLASGARQRQRRRRASPDSVARRASRPGLGRAHDCTSSSTWRPAAIARSVSKCPEPGTRCTPVAGRAAIDGRSTPSSCSRMCSNSCAMSMHRITGGSELTRRPLCRGCAAARSA